MSKAREFWIPRDYQCDFHSGIHVIEYSAYEDVVKNRDWHKGTLSAMVVKEAELYKENQKLLARVQALRDALNKLDSGELWGMGSDKVTPQKISDNIIRKALAQDEEEK